MQLSKNTVIELWHELANVPTVMNGEMATVIDEDFLGWPAGTDVEEIWHFFDDQFADYGGVHVLMYEDPQPERKFRVSTPEGIIECYAKHEKDSDADYPGVYVDIRYTKKQLEEKQIGDMAAVVEYDSGTGNFQTVTYRPGQDEPVCVEVYDREEESVELKDIEAAYARFKIEWMLSHGIKMEDICKLVQEYIEDAKIASEISEQPMDAVFGSHDESISNDFNAYLEEHGFGGMLWPCFEEWLESGECPLAMTYGAFFEKYKYDICFLDVYDENGNEIDDPEVPLNSVVMSFSRLGGNFEVTVRLPKEADNAD